MAPFYPEQKRVFQQIENLRYIIQVFYLGKDAGIISQVNTQQVLHRLDHPGKGYLAEGPE